jgi:hypothetical protein
MILCTTLRRISEHGGCAEQLKRLRAAIKCIYGGKSVTSSERIAYSEIETLIGLEDALWLTRVESRFWPSWRKLAVRFATHVAPLSDDSALNVPVIIAERFAEDRAHYSQVVQARLIAESIALGTQSEPHASVAWAVFAALEGSPRAASWAALKAAGFAGRADEERRWQRETFRSIVGVPAEEVV